MATRKVKLKRCHYFDDNGNPRISGGCNRSEQVCLHAHPSSSDWPTASSSVPPDWLIEKARREKQARTDTHPLPPTVTTERERSRRDESMPPKEPKQWAKPEDPRRRVPPALPATPITTTPPPPKQPPPPPPSFTDVKRPGKEKSAQDLSEKIKIWSQRTEIMSIWMKKDTEYKRAKEQIAELEKQISSTRISPTQQVRQDWDAKLQKLETHAQTILDERTHALETLAESDSWPLGPGSKRDLEMEEKYAELIDMIKDLKVASTSVDSLTKKAEAVIAAKKMEAESTAVDADIAEGSRPNKRRRISTTEHVAVKEPREPKEAEVTALTNELSRIEDLVSNFENELNAHDQELKEGLVSFLEEREREENKASEQEQDERGERIAELEASVKSLDGEVGLIAEELTTLLKDSKMVQETIAQVRQENREAKEEINKANERIQEFHENRSKDLKEIAALNAALAAYMTRPPSPPTTPALLNVEYALQVLDEPLKASVRSMIQPAIEQVRTNVQDMVRDQDARLYDSVWQKLVLTTQMVNTIMATVDKGIS